MPASDSAGDLLFVALNTPPSKIGTYSNLTPIRLSIAGIAWWLRNALGLPKSNRNCGAGGLTAVSLIMTVSYMIAIISTSLAIPVRGINRLRSGARRQARRLQRRADARDRARPP